MRRSMRRERSDKLVRPHPCPHPVRRRIVDFPIPGIRALLSVSPYRPINMDGHSLARTSAPLLAALALLAAGLPLAAQQGQAPPPVAVPVPPTDEFAPGPEDETMPTSVPTPAAPPMASDLVAAPTGPMPVSLPTGPIVSETQSGGRIIEIEQPERVQVYPDDPDSAWWEINPHYAFERAQREQRPLLLLFTGVWNTQAMALSQEVFSTKSFNDYVKENLVICYLNYPRNFTDAPDALRRIKEKFQVRGYPNVLIFNPSGEVERGIRGYRTGRPIDYFNELTAACRPVLESIETQKARLVASGYRDWSNYLGKLIFAKFVERDPTHVVLVDASGQRWTVPLNDLAPDDQRLVESFPAVAKVGRK